jgi:hypothetical protein
MNAVPSQHRLGTPEMRCRTANVLSGAGGDGRDRRLHRQPARSRDGTIAITSVSNAGGSGGRPARGQSSRRRVHYDAGRSHRRDE